MNYMTKESIMDRLHEHYEKASQEDEEIFAIFLQGSQNYIDDLFHKDSDVDSRAIYLPKKKELLLGQDISKPELVLDNDEHVDRFDVRKFLKLIKTPGINNYENLFTEYYIVNPKYKEFHDRVIDINEDLVRTKEKRFVMSLMGISGKDLKDLTKNNKTNAADIAKYGYSRKKLANILRFNKTLKAYLDGRDFQDCLKAMDQEETYKVKKTDYYNLEEAVELASKTDKNTYELAHSHYCKMKDSDFEVITKLDDIFVDLMYASLE